MSPTFKGRRMQEENKGFSAQRMPVALMNPNPVFKRRGEAEESNYNQPDNAFNINNP